MLSMGCRTYLSVHLVVLVVAVDKCYPVVILLYPALALSVPVLPSSLGWDGENAPKTRSFQYICFKSFDFGRKKSGSPLPIYLIGQSFYGARAYGLKMDLNDQPTIKKVPLSPHIYVIPPCNLRRWTPQTLSHEKVCSCPCRQCSCNPSRIWCQGSVHSLEPHTGCHFGGHPP